MLRRLAAVVLYIIWMLSALWIVSLTPNAINMNEGKLVILGAYIIGIILFAIEITSTEEESRIMKFCKEVVRRKSGIQKDKKEEAEKELKKSKNLGIEELDIMSEDIYENLPHPYKTGIRFCIIFTFSGLLLLFSVFVADIAPTGYKQINAEYEVIDRGEWEETIYGDKHCRVKFRCKYDYDGEEKEIESEYTAIVKAGDSIENFDYYKDLSKKQKLYVKESYIVTSRESTAGFDLSGVASRGNGDRIEIKNLDVKLGTEESKGSLAAKYREMVISIALIGLGVISLLIGNSKAGQIEDYIDKCRKLKLREDSDKLDVGYNNIEKETEEISSEGKGRSTE